MIKEEIRIGFVIACVLIILIICFWTFGCKGSNEPLETGIVITPLTGRITKDLYRDNSDFAIISDARINLNDVIEFYLSPEADDKIGAYYPLFMVENGEILVHDLDHYHLGWFYLILIIKA